MIGTNSFYLTRSSFDYAGEPVWLEAMIDIKNGTNYWKYGGINAGISKLRYKGALSPGSGSAGLNESRSDIFNRDLQKSGSHASLSLELATLTSLAFIFFALLMLRQKNLERAIALVKHEDGGKDDAYGAMDDKVSVGVEHVYMQSSSKRNTRNEGIRVSQSAGVEIVRIVEEDRSVLSKERTVVEIMFDDFQIARALASKKYFKLASIGRISLTNRRKRTCLGNMGFAATIMKIISSIVILLALPELIMSQENSSVSKYYHLTVENGRGDGFYKDGKVVPIFAETPRENTTFGHWERIDYHHARPHIDDVHLCNTSLLMPRGNVTVRAHFANGGLYALRVKRGSPNRYFQYGENVTIVADPAQDGEKFGHWARISKLSDARPDIKEIRSPTSTFKMPEGDVYLEAFFVSNELYEFRVRNGYPDYYFAPGQNITITAKDPPQNKVFVKWQLLRGNSTIINDLTSATTTAIMPAERVEIRAKWATEYFELVVKRGVGSGSYKAGSNVSISADENRRVFHKWKIKEGNLSDVQNTKSPDTIVTMSSKKMLIKASFVKGNRRLRKLRRAYFATGDNT